MLEIDITYRLPEFTIQARIQASSGITVLFGPSGAGKSLTLRSVAGLVRPDEGRIVVGDRVLYDSQLGVNLPPQARQVSYVPQDYALFPHLTVARNVALGLKGMPRRQTRSLVDEMLEVMELTRFAGRKPGTLSGGQQQRVALARALVRRPAVLLLDEPFAALDAPVRVQLRQEVRDLQRRFQVPTLLITHDLSEASFIGDQIAVFDRGRVLQFGVPHEVLMRPADLRVAWAVGVKNILPGRVVGSTAEHLQVQVGDDTHLSIPLYPFDRGAEVDLCIRPERVMLQRPDLPQRSRPNVIQGRIVGEMSDGLNCTLYFKAEPRLVSDDAPADLQIDLPVYVYERLDLSRQREWRVYIPPGSIHAVDGS